MDRSQIRDCIAGTRKQGHVKGFEFRKGTGEGAPLGGNLCKPVEGRRQDSSDAWVTYESVSGATRALGFKGVHNISQCLNTGNNRTCGYEFRWPGITTMKRKASQSKQRQVHRQGKMQRGDVVSKGSLIELSSERNLTKKEQALVDLVDAGWIITAKSNNGHYTYDSPRGKR